LGENTVVVEAEPEPELPHLSLFHNQMPDVSPGEVLHKAAQEETSQEQTAPRDEIAEAKKTIPTVAETTRDYLEVGNVTPVLVEQHGSKTAAHTTIKPKRSAQRRLLRQDRQAKETESNEGASVANGQVAVERHIIQPNETFASIARMYYGSERYTRFLMQANPDLADPRALAVGAEVLIPPKPNDDEAGMETSHGRTGGEITAKVSVPSASSKHTYRVKTGDSFYGIARSVLGSASRWKELLELNRELVAGEPTNLRPGQILILPED